MRDFFLNLLFSPQEKKKYSWCLSVVVKKLVGSLMPPTGMECGPECQLRIRAYRIIKYSLITFSSWVISRRSIESSLYIPNLTIFRFWIKKEKKKKNGKDNTHSTETLLFSFCIFSLWLNKFPWKYFCLIYCFCLTNF